MLTTGRFIKEISPSHPGASVNFRTYIDTVTNHNTHHEKRSVYIFPEIWQECVVFIRQEEEHEERGKGGKM